LSTSQLQQGGQTVLAIVVDIPDGLHAQSSTPTEKEFIAFAVEMQPVEGLTIGEAIFPPGALKTYPMLGELSVLDGKVVIYVPIAVAGEAPLGSTELRGTVTYQLCDDQNCFPPESPEILIPTEIVAPTRSVQATQPELFRAFDPSVFANLQPAAAKGVSQPEQSQKFLGLELRHNAYCLAFAGAFVVGIFFNIVPCVLPVLPLKALGFYEVAQHNRAKCFALGVVFSLGIVATFAALAFPIFVLKSMQWGEVFGNPWFAAGITVVLLAMAFGMFGAFGVGLPTWVYRITPRHDTYSGNFAFGILTAVLSTPCTFGMFLALLAWAALQPALVAILLLVIVGSGMAFPYLILSLFPEVAKKFPRTGPWSNVVKQMMGFLLLATAVFFGQMFLPDVLGHGRAWWIIFGLIAVSGVFLVVRAIQLSGRAVAVGVCVAIALGLIVPSFFIVNKLANPPIDWTYYDPEILAKARESGQPVLVKFTASWCANCHTVEITVFGDAETVAFLRQNKVVTIKADLTKQSASGWDLLRQLHPVGAIPFTVIYMPGEASPRALPGIYSSTDLRGALASRPTMSAR
jgi:thiol:disulfide interchange protein DsbD